MIDNKTRIGTVVIRDELDNCCLECVESSRSQLGRSLAKSDYESGGSSCIERQETQLAVLGTARTPLYTIQEGCTTITTSS
jgi:hypothetical protein